MKSKNRENLQRVSGIIEGLVCDRVTSWSALLSSCIGLIEVVLNEEPEEPTTICIVDETNPPKRFK